jgi:hypothetical protein
MYFPKSQIKPNQSTSGGEFIVESTGEEYVGSYFSTSTGEYYTGKNPQDQPVRLLVELESKIINDQTLGTNLTPLSPTNPTIWTWDYLGITSTPTEPPFQPTRIYPLPSELDYKLGEFQRYFLSKTNEPMFIEINKEQYQKYINRDETVAYQLYQPLTLPWQIAGDRNQVYNTNKNIVEKTERDNRLRGFKSYFKERYDQFYK